MALESSKYSLLLFMAMTVMNEMISCDESLSLMNIHLKNLFFILFTSHSSFMGEPDVCHFTTTFEIDYCTHLKEIC
jgi:hypothetical protein